MTTDHLHEGVRRRVYPGLDQVVLRALIVLGATMPLVAAAAAGARPPGWLQLLVLAFTLNTALRPESVSGIAMLLGSAYVWALAPSYDSPVVLLAAGGLVLAHVAGLLAAQGPARMQVDLRQVRLWGWRGTALCLAAAAVWALARLLVDAPDDRPVYAGGLVVLTAVAVLTTWLLGVRRDRA